MRVPLVTKPIMACLDSFFIGGDGFAFERRTYVDRGEAWVFNLFLWATRCLGRVLRPCKVFASDGRLMVIAP